MSKKGFEVWCRNCGCLMKLRDGKFGKFYGCTGYPKCKNTLNEREAALEDDRPNESWDDHLGAGGDYDPGGDFD